MSEAVRRVANSDAYQGSHEPAAIRSWLRRIAAGANGVAPAVRGMRTLVHPSLHPALSQVPDKDRTAETIKALPEHRRNRTLAKIAALNAFADYLRGPGRGLGKVDARQRFVRERQGSFTYIRDGKRRELHLSCSSLAAWERRYRDGGADALARDGRGRPLDGGPSPEAAELYWLLRNDPRCFKISACHRRVALEAASRGWTWFRSYPACAAWDKLTRNDRALELNRKGDGHYQAKCGRYVELDPESFSPGECLVGDDHTFNAWVQMPNGKVLRPVLSAWQDWRSRAVGGFRVVAEGNEHSLLLAFADAAESFGLPATVIADNGKNFTSWQWRGDKPKRRVYRKPGDLAGQAEGIFALTGITPSWCLPYSPNGKARLERWFGTLDDQFSRGFASYCGASPEDRPDAHAELVKHAVPFDEFTARLQQYVGIYNSTPHSGEGMDGRTPLQVMALAPRKRMLSDDLKPLLLASWHRPISISRNGVALRICGATVRYGAADPALRELAIGTKVRVAYDPQDVTSVAVWTMDYRYLCTAAMNERHNRSCPAEQLRETMRSIAREKRTLKQARRVGTDYLRDPVERSIAALAREAAQRRVPDPPGGPDGSPILVPARTPLKLPAKAVGRKAAGAEGMEVTVGMDAHQRFAEFPRKPSAKPKRGSAYAALSRWAERQGGS